MQAQFELLRACRWRATTRRSDATSAVLATWLVLVVIAAILVSPARAQHVTNIEYLTFDTNVAPNAPASPVQLKALLYIPVGASSPLSAVVITPSSGGVREDIEIHYASTLARSGIAALVIDSFGPRAVSFTVHDQTLVTSWQTANDAIAGLRFLAADKRFRQDRIGILGVSKGGITAMMTALTQYLTWTGESRLRFAAHIAIAPSCGWVLRSTKTTDAPVLFMLAELDDQCPAADCVQYAEALRRGGNASVEVTVYPGAHHAWEILGSAPQFDKWAENYAKCRAVVEDDGSNLAHDGTRFSANDWNKWAKASCMTLGGTYGGGNRMLKIKATDDAISFLKRHGF